MAYDREPFNSYQAHLREGSDCLYNHIANTMRTKQTARIASIGPGQGLRDLPAELQVKSGYSGAYGRLDYRSAAPTITRWVFHVGSGRFAHPREVRGLTMREAARIQSFSDDFHFLGSRNDQAGQIGNAVPPYFMEQLADKITDALQGREEEYQQLALFQAFGDDVKLLNVRRQFEALKKTASDLDTNDKRTSDLPCVYPGDLFLYRLSIARSTHPQYKVGYLPLKRRISGCFLTSEGQKSVSMLRLETPRHLQPSASNAPIRPRPRSADLS